MRYVYGITAALLLGGSVAALTSGPVGAQIAQNEPGTITPAAPRGVQPGSFADLAEKLSPAVVNISTKQSIQVARRQNLPPGFEEFFRRFGAPVPGDDDSDGDSGGSGGGNGGSGGNNGGGTVTQRGGSLGSGFLISPDGYVVTNNHVISPARSGATVDEITVTLSDRREFTAKLVGRDEASDLALLKIDAASLPFVRFGDSAHARVGDWVLAVGNPFGLGGNTVTAGIISAVHRNIGAGSYDRYIQTDASINSGNSGGPMFDTAGNVIGINTALISPTGGNVGIGFAIPAEQARPVIDSLRRGEKVRRGYIGVSLQDLDEGIASSLGVPRNRGMLIRGVTPDGPAARAGIRQGDVVVGVAGREVTPDQTLSWLIAQQPVGSKIPLDLVRNGQRQQVTITVAERPTEQELAKLGGAQDEQEVTEPPASEQSTGQKSARASLGVTVQTLTPEIARSLRLADTAVKGVVVASVDPSSDAAAEGVRTGDIILSINQRETPTPEAAAAAVDAVRKSGRKSALLLIRRGNAPPLYVGVGIQGS